MSIFLFLGSFLQGGNSPFFYELAAEVTYPLPEGVSAGIIVLIYNFSSLVMLIIAPYFTIEWVNIIFTIGVFICGLIILLFVKV